MKNFNLSFLSLLLKKANQTIGFFAFILFINLRYIVKFVNMAKNYYKIVIF